MRRFTELYLRLDRSNRTLEKVAALLAYFEQAPPADAAWAVAALTGRGLVRAVPSSRLRAWASESAGLPGWLVGRCHEAVGDLSEAIAQVLPEPELGAMHDETLAELVERRILPLAHLDEPGQRELVERAWSVMSLDQRLLYHKLIRGALRVGVSRKLVVRALAEHAGLSPAVMDHRLVGKWRPSAEAFRSLVGAEASADAPTKPYPFMLAPALDRPADTLGPVEAWQVEWKWDGIRAQLIRRGSICRVWSRGDEDITGGFPELAASAGTLPCEAVLDGELLAWDRGRPLPFSDLQRRLNRRHVELSLFPEVPVVFMAYDLLEERGEDLRHEPLYRRRNRLESVVREADGILLSEVLARSGWGAVGDAVAASRGRGTEGVMIKRLASEYGVGRSRGDWWKWKADPYTLDAVLVQAQPGSGKRAGLYTSYTFAVWHDGRLVPVTKAYSGLSQDEIERVDRFVRSNTKAKHGPVRSVDPKLVFEIAFEGLSESKRHKAGIALRFPRMARWREDKQPEDADTLDTVRGLLRAFRG